MKTLTSSLKHEDINFTVEKMNINILDILIKKQNDTLSTDIFYKERDSKQNINFKTCHPSHTKSMPYNLARRIWTIVSNKETRNLRQKELFVSLTSRNYPKQLLENGLNGALKIPRPELLITKPKHGTNIVTYGSTHNPKKTLRCLVLWKITSPF